MVSHDDDLSPFADDPVVRALTGPGTTDELAGETDALAAFRAAVPVRSRRRLAGRLGVGGTTLGLAIALSGGVAAAYSSSLPTPVQQWAHEVTNWLGPVKVPAAPHKPKPTGGHSVAVIPVTPPSSTTPTTAASPTSSPSHHPRHPAARHTQRPSRTPRPSATASPTKPAIAATPTPTPTPTATPTPSPTTTPAAASITISLSQTTVSPGATVSAYGQLATASGDPIAGDSVWLLERTPGTSGVSQVDSGTTDANGSVTLQTPALTRSVRLRLVTGDKLRSAWIAVILQPTVTATVSSAGDSSTIRISTDGATPGDMIDIQRHAPGGGWQDVAANQLDSSGSAVFGVPTPPRRPDHYRAILRRTPQHGYAATHFEVPPG